MPPPTMIGMLILEETLLIIAGLTGTTLFVVGEYFGEREYLILTYAVFAGFITLIREIIKDTQ